MQKEALFIFVWHIANNIFFNLSHLVSLAVRKKADKLQNLQAKKKKKKKKKAKKKMSLSKITFYCFSEKSWFVTSLGCYFRIWREKFYFTPILHIFHAKRHLCLNVGNIIVRYATWLPKLISDFIWWSQLLLLFIVVHFERCCWVRVVKETYIFAFW